MLFNYGKRNAILGRDSYPIPRMAKCIESLEDAKFITSLDNNSSYWHVKIPEEDWDKTKFTYHAGLFCSLRIPFGIRNVPATFRRAQNIILSKFRLYTSLVYINDAVIYYRSVEDHFGHI